ncbi:hypothetical protein SDC9_205525 [bioreactor metagenome]|uniref:Uncharacterized protein n=1 Tax=bioreactor metagenome TaxID=1076179 RepID=A0A645J2L6_9ZZZZ
MASFFSNIVILYPLLAKLNAKVIPAGPEPTIAILSSSFLSCVNFAFFKYSLDI